MFFFHLKQVERLVPIYVLCQISPFQYKKNAGFREIAFKNALSSADRASIMFEFDRNTSYLVSLVPRQACDSGKDHIFPFFPLLRVVH